MVRQEVLAVKVVDAEISKKFDDIKEFLGLKNDAEVVRFLVNFFWRRIQQKGSSVFVDVDSDAEVEEVEE